MVNSEVERNGAVAAVDGTACEGMGGGVVADGVGVAVYPVIGLAGGAGVGTSGFRTDGESQTDGAVATVGCATTECLNRIRC